jgi:hypothetical protein
MPMPRNTREIRLTTPSKLDSRNPSNTPKTSLLRKKDKVTTFQERLMKMMNEGYIDDVYDVIKLIKAGDPLVYKESVAISLYTQNLILR